MSDKKRPLPVQIVAENIGPRVIGLKVKVQKTLIGLAILAGFVGYLYYWTR